jgi:hypothetical protein
MVLGIKAIRYENELKQRDETIKRQAEQIKLLEAEIEQLKRLLAGKAESKTAKKPKFTENYSLDKNKRKKKRRKKSTGRRSNDTKRVMIEDHHDIYWPDADPDECICHLKPLRKPLALGKSFQIVAIGRRFWYNVRIKRSEVYQKVPVGNVG